MNERETLRSLLAMVYRPEGVEVWLYAAHQEFGWLTVDEMEADGRMDEVLAAADRLRTGGYA